MERLLCIKIASRGDLLLAAPAFKQVRLRRPKAHLSLLVGASCAEVAQHLPFFDEIVQINDRELLSGNTFSKIKAAQRLLRIIRRGGIHSGLEDKHYSEILIFHRDWRYGFLGWLAGVRTRKGFHRGWSSLFLTNSYKAPETEHHIHQYIHMSLSEKCDDQGSEGEIWKFGEGEKEKSLLKASQFGFDRSQKYCALAFGGGKNVKTQTQLKSWPVHHFKTFATMLKMKGYKALWLGDSEDAKMLSEDIIEGQNLAGKLSISEAASIISECKLLVGNDSFLLHLGEALRIPTLGLFGPTNPAHYRPLGKKSRYLWLGESLTCSPCHVDGYFPPCHFQHRCMNDLSPELVMKQVQELA
jgi:lipopolysaccharide heptosyltransferase II